jgi:hypothetical protein
MGGWNWKKLKDGYPKLTCFKVWIPYLKNDKRSRIISESFFLLKRKNVISQTSVQLLSNHKKLFFFFKKKKQ